MLLTLDLGGHLGFTKGPRDAAAPIDAVRVGTVRLKDTTNLGVWLRSGDDGIRQLLGGDGVTVTDLVVERPNTGQGSHHNGIVKLCALLGHVGYWASFYGLPAPTLYTAGQGKLRVTGNGNAKKELVMSGVMDLGWSPDSFDCADAIALRLVHLFGVPPNKAQREKAAAAARRAAKAAKTPALL